ALDLKTMDVLGFDVAAFTPVLFNDTSNTVNFNSLTATQKAALSNGVSPYGALAGDDSVVLPNVENYALTSGVTWDSSNTFSAGAGNDKITGGNGNDT